jgi:2-oxo-4-hydroxy-4-carboxy-5-ureidoimidazoline decarboxylase
MLARRPFASVESLYETADKVWIWLYEEDWLEAFTHHPKIGDIDSLRAKFANTKAWAEGEQSGVEAASEEVLQGLAAGNSAYEAKFGYIFIVCATGKSAGEMLAILNSRLPNDPAVELQLAAVEQQKITRIRLEKLLS